MPQDPPQDEPEAGPSSQSRAYKSPKNLKKKTTGDDINIEKSLRRIREEQKEDANEVCKIVKLE